MADFAIFEGINGVICGLIGLGIAVGARKIYKKRSHEQFRTMANTVAESLTTPFFQYDLTAKLKTGLPEGHQQALLVREFNSRALQRSLAPFYYANLFNYAISLDAGKVTATIIDNAFQRTLARIQPDLQTRADMADDYAVARGIQVALTKGAPEQILYGIVADHLSKRHLNFTTDEEEVIRSLLQDWYITQKDFGFKLVQTMHERFPNKLIRW
jgi:hypothetical protein